MLKQHSRFGLLSSILMHSALFGGVWAVSSSPKIIKVADTEQMTSISMEMMAALLEQPQVAVAPEEESEPESESEPEVVAPEPEPEAIAEPVVKPIVKPKKEPPKKEPPKKEKPKAEKPKEKPKDKPKLDKPKEKKEPAKKPEKPIKALETGKEAKQGIVAKAIPNAVQGKQERAGVVNGSPQGVGTVGSKNGSLSGTGASGNGGSKGELQAYMAGLRTALQRKAMSTYPAREKMMRKTGVVKLAFSVSPSGQVTNVRLLSSSGSEGLDAAAIKVAQSLKHSPPPSNLPATISVPIRYAIQ